MLCRFLLTEVRWRLSIGGVDRARKSMATAGGYSDRVPEGNGQVCCQATQFLRIQFNVREHFGSAGQERGPEVELDLFSIVGQARQVAGRAVSAQVAGLVVGA
ncbi:hypothetical protein ADK92_15420 [Streptomyces sp. XY533]|nr:hypothetical protein ADK92_15420 [Streptomyces sp. XY533]